MQGDVRRAILVPLDGSELAERALGPARQLAVATGATLLLVRVVPDPMAGLSDEIEDAQRYLAGLAIHLRAPAGAEVAPVVLTQACAGNPAERIVREAELWRTDLIVMSAHGRGGLGRLVHGSVADAVLRASPVPVLLVPARCGAVGGLLGDVILAPVDGSRFAEVALGRAAELARELCAPLVVLYATHFAPTPVAGLAPTFAMIDEMMADGRAYVAGLVEPVRRAGVDARGEVVVGAPATAILECAERLSAAAVVMATHGRGGLSRLAFGSVADEVLRQSRRPLLLLRPLGASASAEEVRVALPAGSGAVAAAGARVR
jgi:nucleotide-binding universal stress UspA family protein